MFLRLAVGTPTFGEGTGCCCCPEAHASESHQSGMGRKIYTSLSLSAPVVCQESRLLVWSLVGWHRREEALGEATWVGGQVTLLAFLQEFVHSGGQVGVCWGDAEGEARCRSAVAPARATGEPCLQLCNPHERALYFAPSRRDAASSLLFFPLRRERVSARGSGGGGRALHSPDLAERGSQMCLAKQPRLPLPSVRNTHRLDSRERKTGEEGAAGWHLLPRTLCGAGLGMFFFIACLNKFQTLSGLRRGSGVEFLQKH